MTKKAYKNPEFPTINEIKYLNIAKKKNDCAVFTDYIPLVFIRNPHKVKLGSIQFASGLGMIYFRLGAEDKARKIGNLFSDLDFHYANFMGAIAPPQRKFSAELHESMKSSLKCTEYFIPSGLKPHDGIEYVLMNKGFKHVAMFEYSLPIEFLTNPLRIEMKYIDFNNGNGRIYYTPGHEFSANELRKEIVRTDNIYDEIHIRRVGSFLGYQRNDIEQYIEYCSESRDFYA
jgi:hypothetical protein